MVSHVAQRHISVDQSLPSLCSQQQYLQTDRQIDRQTYGKVLRTQMELFGWARRQGHRHLFVFSTRLHCCYYCECLLLQDLHEERRRKK